MRFAYRRYDDYEKFVEAVNTIFIRGWALHSWQDVGGEHGIDIRALFERKIGAHELSETI